MIQPQVLVIAAKQSRNAQQRGLRGKAQRVEEEQLLLNAQCPMPHAQCPL
ncbi:hypothetical protein NIES2107_25980 [Nostoc carneum NIES-2107]|nr:hypothetical protein NIES2107_25980 [Nostoc carneum NIES-2107]